MKKKYALFLSLVFILSNSYGQNTFNLQNAVHTQINSDSGDVISHGPDSGYFVMSLLNLVTEGFNNFELVEEASFSSSQTLINSSIVIGNSSNSNITEIERELTDNLPDFTTGINSPLDSNLLVNIVPNPNTGRFKINLSNENLNNYKISIRNSLGQVVYSTIIQFDGSFNQDIDLSEFGVGFYFIQIQNGSKRTTRKIIIQ